MSMHGIVATLEEPDNSAPSTSETDASERTARARARVARSYRIPGVLLLFLPALVWLTTGTFYPELFVPIVLLIVLVEAEAVLLPLLDRRTQSVAIVAFRVTFVVLVVVGVQPISFWGWLAPALLGLVLLNGALTLSARPLAVVTLCVSAGNIVAALLSEHHELNGTFETHPSLGELLAVSLFVYPAIAIFLNIRGRRTRDMRQRLERTIRALRTVRDDLESSQEQLKRWNRQLNAEVERQTTALEERNRYLSIINAVSFALAEPMDDARSLERAVRLVARLLGMRAAQAYTRSHGGAVVDLFVTVAPEDVYAPRLPEVLLRSVAQTGRPLTSTHPDWEPDVELPDLGEPYHVVPLVAKGRVLGSFALIGQGTLRNDDDGRHLLLLVGREMGVALENARLYQQAIEKADREEFLTEVTRLLNTSGRGERALPPVLDLLLNHVGAREAMLVTLPEGTRDVMVAATVVADDGEPLLEHLAQPLARMVSDRATPMVLGLGGESPLSDRFTSDGITAVVVAPVYATRGNTGVMDSPRQPDQVTTDDVFGLPVLAGALVLATSSREEWRDEQTSLVHRVADVIARRVQADELVSIQQQRIRELTGLAEVARTMQSGADVERLYSGFATALHRLIPYQRLFIARLDDSGVLVDIPTFGSRGHPIPTSHGAATEVSHPWLHSRSSVLWRRGDSEPPVFLPDDVRNAVVVPMRPKGQMLGAVVVALPRQIRGDQVNIVEQAVEQLSLALDGATLYQQATARASHIQALSNLARIVASVVNLREAFAAFSEEVRWLIPFDRAVMFMLDEHAGTVEPYATYPNESEQVPPGPLSTSIASVPLSTASAVTFHRDDPRYANLDWDLLGGDVREVAAVPVRQGDRTSAVFALVNNAGGDYTMTELDALEEVAGLLAVTIERLQLYEQADYSAKHDLLTGLPNYRFLQERLSDLHAGIDQDGESVLLVVDMDSLKVFNDSLGHEVGDQVIQSVAAELVAACRQGDFVARTGGDEFVIVMEGVGLDAATRVADRIHDALHDAHLKIDGAPVRIGVSIGIAVAPGDAETTADLIHAADQAMYDAKFAGGQRTRTAREHHEGVSEPRQLRGRNLRLAESLARTLSAGASADELACISLANRWVAAVTGRLDVRPEVVPHLRLVVTSQARRRLATPQRDRDQLLAEYLVERISLDWRALPSDGGKEIVTLLIPSVLDIAWLMLPRPAGEGLSTDRALARYVEMYPQAAMHPAWSIIEEAVRSTVDRRREAA